MKNIILTANGTQKADLVLKNASIVNVFTESIEVGDVAITDGKIVGIGRYEGKIEKDMTGRFVCPGFIDGHIHLESSMVTLRNLQELSSHMHNRRDYRSTRDCQCCRL